MVDYEEKLERIVKMVREVSCYCVSGAELRDALGHERLGPKVREKVEEALEACRIGRGSPLPSSENDRVLLYDERPGEPVQELLRIAGKLKGRDLTEDASDLYAARVRRFAAALRNT